MVFAVVSVAAFAGSGGNAGNGTSEAAEGVSGGSCFEFNGWVLADGEEAVLAAKLLESRGGAETGCEESADF